VANYLFEDFEGLIERLSNSLSFEKKIDINYNYINLIHSAKGKHL